MIINGLQGPLSLQNFGPGYAGANVALAIFQKPAPAPAPVSKNKALVSYQFHTPDRFITTTPPANPYQPVTPGYLSDVFGYTIGTFKSNTPLSIKALLSPARQQLFQFVMRLDHDALFDQVKTRLAKRIIRKEGLEAVDAEIQANELVETIREHCPELIAKVTQQVLRASDKPLKPVFKQLQDPNTKLVSIADLTGMMILFDGIVPLLNHLEPGYWDSQAGQAVTTEAETQMKAAGGRRYRIHWATDSGLHQRCALDGLLSHKEYFLVEAYISRTPPQTIARHIRQITTALQLDSALDRFNQQHQLAPLYEQLRTAS